MNPASSPSFDPSPENNYLNLRVIRGNTVPGKTIGSGKSVENGNLDRWMVTEKAGCTVKTGGPCPHHGHLSWMDLGRGCDGGVGSGDEGGKVLRDRATCCQHDVSRKESGKGAKGAVRKCKGMEKKKRCQAGKTLLS